jgi:DNA adenine methylase
MGSKRRIANELNSIMQPFYKDYGVYVEPFVGGANMIKSVTHPNRIGYDSNEYIIAYFNALKYGWLPPKDVSEESYKDIKNNKDKYPKELVCFVGICCSFAGKWFGGYARDRIGKNYATIGFNSCIKNDVPLTRNFANEGHNYAVKKDLPYIKPVTFIHSDYRDIVFTEPTIIYCDPPYRNVTAYKDKFDHEQFYEWCHKQKSNGHKLFISEYNMPNDFTCIWSKEQAIYLDNNTNTPRNVTERLYTL